MMKSAGDIGGVVKILQRFGGMGFRVNSMRDFGRPGINSGKIYGFHSSIVVRDASFGSLIDQFLAVDEVLVSKTMIV